MKKLLAIVILAAVTAAHASDTAALRSINAHIRELDALIRAGGSAELVAERAILKQEKDRIARPSRMTRIDVSTTDPVLAALKDKNNEHVANLEIQALRREIRQLRSNRLQGR